jgi:hypothetical protein
VILHTHARAHTHIYTHHPHINICACISVLFKGVVVTFVSASLLAVLVVLVLVWIVVTAVVILELLIILVGRPGLRVWYSDSLQAGRSGVWTAVGVRHSIRVHTETQIPVCCTMGTGCLSGGSRGWGVAFITYVLLASRLFVVRAISLTHRSNQMHYFYYLKLKTIYNISLWYTTNCL